MTKDQIKSITMVTVGRGGLWVRAQEDLQIYEENALSRGLKLRSSGSNDPSDTWIYAGWSNVGKGRAWLWGFR